MPDSPATVFIIDDDEAIRDGLSMLLYSHGYEPQAFSRGPDFLARCDNIMPERFMAILDLNMPGIDGLSLQVELQRRGLDIPLVFLSGDGDIPSAVDAVQKGAVDFVEKPVDTSLLIELVEKALNLQKDRNEATSTRRQFRVRLETLTRREREVLENIAEGKTSNVTASELGISERTIELHRSRILKKMGVRNSTELLNLVIPNLEASK